MKKNIKIIIITTLISLLFNIFVRDAAANLVFSTIVFQLLSSCILTYVISQFINTIKEYDWTKSWMILYVVIVSLTIILFYAGLPPLSNS